MLPDAKRDKMPKRFVFLGFQEGGGDGGGDVRDMYQSGLHTDGQVRGHAVSMIPDVKCERMINSVVFFRRDTC